MKKYIIILLSMLYSVGVFGQVTAKHFNAGWNSANGVSWFMDLKDCSTKGIVDISKDTESAQKYKIAVVPTIIIFKDGEEVARFQADLSFKMQATKEEVQEEIDNILMSDF
jgi:thiol-disulfide isomerase/thioredoxin|tara:strand:- start:1916 stop:2248 length:333 start_codon:yes stop_codon:yes gene_type:complete